MPEKFDFSKMPNCFYRVSVKGLSVRDEKILLVQEAQQKGGLWELPGGGFEYGESFKDCLTREVKEEMGLDVIKMSKRPTYIWISYFDNMHRLLLGFKVEFSSLNFKRSSECVALGFFSLYELKDLNLHPNVQRLAEIFRPEDFK